MAVRCTQTLQWFPESPEESEDCRGYPPSSSPPSSSEWSLPRTWTPSTELNTTGTKQSHWGMSVLRWQLKSRRLELVDKVQKCCFLTAAQRPDGPSWPLTHKVVLVLLLWAFIVWGEGRRCSDNNLDQIVGNGDKAVQLVHWLHHAKKTKMMIIMKMKERKENRPSSVKSTPRSRGIIGGEVWRPDLLRRSSTKRKMALKKWAKNLEYGTKCI